MANSTSSLSVVIDSASARESTASLEKMADVSASVTQVMGALESALSDMGKTLKNVNDAFAGWLSKTSKPDTQSDSVLEPWVIGVNKAASDYGSSAGDAADNIEKAFSTAFKGVGDGIVDLVTKGKANFKSLADTLVADLARVAVQQGLSGLLKGGANSLIYSISNKVSSDGGDGLGEFIKLKDFSNIEDGTDSGKSTAKTLGDVGKSGTDAASDISKAFSGAFDGLTNSLVSFATTGKGSFKDFANSLIADLIRIASQAQITGLFKTGLSALIDWLGGSTASVPSTAGMGDSQIPPNMAAQGNAFGPTGILPLSGSLAVADSRERFFGESSVT